MAIVYGLTDQGLVVKSRAVTRSDFNLALRRAFGNAMNLGDSSVLGQIVGIFSDRVGELWELLEMIASSQDPDKATSSLLDAICLITGTKRPLAAQSSVSLTLTGVDGTAVPALSLFETATTLKDFATQDPVTLAAVDAWVSSTLYAVDDRVVNGANIYQCIGAGTSGGAVGPTGSGDVITDNSATWTFVGEGTAAVDVDALSVDEGPVVGAVKDIRKVVNAISGLQGVTNLKPAILGRLVAKDPELRVLREAELGQPGSSPFDALIGRLHDVPSVTSVTLFVNNTDLTDSDGVPPHSVEALIQGGADQDIFDKLLASVAAGIGTHGNVSGTAIDKTGKAQPESFSRATEVQVYVRLVVNYDATSFPADGNSQIIAAIEQYGTAQGIGRDVVPAAVSAQSFKALPTSVNDVPYAMVYTDVIAPPTAWLPSTVYSATVGSRSVVTNGGRAYICVTSGTSAASGGPLTTGTNIVDNTAHWYFLGNTITITSRQLAVYADVAVTSSGSTP